MDKTTILQKESLNNFILNHSNLLNEDLIKSIMQQLLSLVDSLHSNNFLIGDINQAQIFIAPNGKLVLFPNGDFEKIRKSDLNFKEFSSEMWMIGIMFMKLAKLISQNKNLNLYRLIQIVSEGDVIEEIKISKDAWDLMKRLLSKKPRNRITASRALLHDWFKLSV